MVDNQKARIFISCGQREDGNELYIAKKLKEKLENMGYSPYIALEEQTLDGLKENILPKLRELEYMIFIDFKRERLFESKDNIFVDTGKYRGSLFSHQELAIAAFLDMDFEIEVIAFQEEGVKTDDGILKFLQTNCIQFTDRNSLPEKIIQKIKEKKWNPTWRHELLVEREAGDILRNILTGPEGKPAAFFHIRVKNCHKTKIARNCVVYLESFRTISSNTERSPESVEFKWKGVTIPMIPILPNNFRKFDAFFVFEDSQNVVNLGINTSIVDYSKYKSLYTLKGPGNFELTFIVLSENFPTVKAKYQLNIRTKIEHIEFFKIS